MQVQGGRSRQSEARGLLLQVSQAASPHPGYPFTLCTSIPLRQVVFRSILCHRSLNHCVMSDSFEANEQVKSFKRMMPRHPRGAFLALYWKWKGEWRVEACVRCSHGQTYLPVLPPYTQRFAAMLYRHPQQSWKCESEPSILVPGKTDGLQVLRVCGETLEDTPRFQYLKLW